MASSEMVKRVKIINSTHLQMIEFLETKKAYSFWLVNASIEASALFLERELLPYLDHYDKLISTLQNCFHKDLSDVLQTVNEVDKTDLRECCECIKRIAKERQSEMKPLSGHEAGKATSLGKDSCF